MNQIAKINWPYALPGLIEVWKDNRFLVQVYEGKAPVKLRITVNRIDREGDRWVDGITWDELQAIKEKIGRGDDWAVEIYPAKGHLVNDANMRHLWLLDKPPEYGWKRDSKKSG